MVYDIKGPVMGENASVSVERIRGTTRLVVTGIKHGTATIRVKLVLDQIKANKTLNPVDQPAAENMMTGRFEESGRAFSRLLD
ncbi:MAG: hypothetical protein VB858_07585 [Planctomycetaceae bacterium]